MGTEDSQGNIMNGRSNTSTEHLGELYITELFGRYNRAEKLEVETEEEVDEDEKCPYIWHS